MFFIKESALTDPIGWILNKPITFSFQNVPSVTAKRFSSI